MNGSLTNVLLGWRRLVVRTTTSAIVVSIVVSLLLPKWYRATATILPPQEGSAGGGLLDLMSQLGASVGTGPASAAQRLLSQTPVTDFTIGVLKSKRVRGEIVDRFHLIEIYDVKFREQAIAALKDHLEVGTTPEGLIRVRVEDRDPTRAAEMANAFLEVLDEFNRKTSVEDAQRAVEFIESCLLENETRRAQAAERLRRFQEEKGAVEISEQTRVTVEAIAALQAERTRLEIQRGVLENYATPNQLEVQRVEAQIREIDRTLATLEGDNTQAAEEEEQRTAPPPSSGVLLTLGEIPKLGLEFANLKREVLVQEKVYQLLTSQYEEARIRVARDQKTITVLDEAVPPLRKVRPRRTLIVALTALLAFAASIAVALVADSTLNRVEGASALGQEAPIELRSVVGMLAKLRNWCGPRVLSESPRAD